MLLSNDYLGLQGEFEGVQNEKHIWYIYKFKKAEKQFTIYHTQAQALVSNTYDRGTDDEENEYVSYDGIRVTTETDDFGRKESVTSSGYTLNYTYKNGSGTLCDLYYNSLDACVQFGRRSVNVYILA